MYLTELKSLHSQIEEIENLGRQKYNELSYSR